MMKRAFKTKAVKTSEGTHSAAPHLDFPNRAYGSALTSVMTDASSHNFQLTPQGVLQLQRTVGNRAAGRFIQAKLKVGQPGDKYEQEADRVAAQVVNQINSPQSVQRETTLEAVEETVPTKPVIQKVSTLGSFNSSGGGVIAASPQLEADIERAQGGGHPLPNQVCAPMEQAFGADFSRVRVYTDSAAHANTKALQAKAFTDGNNIVFGHGYYAPETLAGKKLLAHELAHVVQQHQNLPHSNEVQIQLSPDLRFGSRTITLRVRWHGDYDVFKRMVRTLAIRQLEIPAAWIDQLLHVRHAGDLRSAYGVLDRADPLRRNGTVVVIRADYSAQRSVGASNLVFSVIRTPIAVEPRIPHSEHVRPPLTAPEIEAPTRTWAREEEALVPTTEEREAQEKAVYHSTRKLLAAFILGTSLYELIGEPLHGPLQQAFGPSHPWTRGMQQHPRMESVRESIRGRLETYCVQSRQAEVGVPPSHPVQLHGRDDFNLNTLTLHETVQWLGADILNWMSWGRWGQESAWVFGSFRLFWDITNPIYDGRNANADVIFVAWDSLHLRSATRIPLTSIGLEDQPLGEGMPLNNIPIFWYWRERLGSSRHGE